MRPRSSQVLLITLMLLAYMSAEAAPVPMNGSASLQNASCETDRTLYPSSPPMTGDDVAELQTRLIELGLFKGGVTGRYDDRTIDAVKKVQRDFRMPVNGITDHDVWFALGSEEDFPISSGAASLPPPARPIRVTIDLQKLKLTVFSKEKDYWSFPIAIGKQETPSPVGEFRIVNKSTNWGGGFGTRWMGLNVPWGTYGIHGTNKPWSIGRQESHGCFRMYNVNAEILYRWLPVGTPVDIISRYARTSPSRRMKEGSSGQDVAELQMALKRVGVNPGRADGRFGKDTTKSIMDFHRKYGLPGDGTVTADTYALLRLLGPWPGKGVPSK